jgi:hypothetical protein
VGQQEKKKQALSGLNTLASHARSFDLRSQLCCLKSPPTIT